MQSIFGKTFIFLTKLAWESRVTIPILVTAAFMAMDIRMQFEINIQTERVIFPELGNDDNDSDSDESWQTIDSDNSWRTLSDNEDE